MDDSRRFILAWRTILWVGAFGLVTGSLAGIALADGESDVDQCIRDACAREEISESCSNGRDGLPSITSIVESWWHQLALADHFRALAEEPERPGPIESTEVEVVLTDDILAGRVPPELLLKGGKCLLILPPTNEACSLLLSLAVHPNPAVAVSDGAPPRAPRKLPTELVDSNVRVAKPTDAEPIEVELELGDFFALLPPLAPERLPEHHRVNYPPPQKATPPPATAPRAHGPTSNWRTIANSTLSCHFQGATLHDVAQFFHHATGLTVRLDPSVQKAGVDPAGIHVRCRNRPTEQSLRVVLGSVGLGYVVSGGELVLIDPVVGRAAVKQTDVEIESCWFPAEVDSSRN